MCFFPLAVQPHRFLKMLRSCVSMLFVAGSHARQPDFCIRDLSVDVPDLNLKFAYVMC